MCQNVNNECACVSGYDKGAIKKTIENNIFTIFGNVNKKSSIILRYHGLLTDNFNNNEYTLVYFFDNLEDEKKEVKLNKCTKCLGIEYCTSIDLDENNKISFEFRDKFGNIEKNNNILFELDINKDPISLLMERYGFEKNLNLPVAEQKDNKKLNYIKNLFQSIKLFFNKILIKD